MREIKLKPCPFCGGNAKVYSCGLFINCEAKVMCPRCRIQTASYKEVDVEDAIWFAANAWNRRMKESVDV